MQNKIVFIIMPLIIIVLLAILTFSQEKQIIPTAADKVTIVRTAWAGKVPPGVSTEPVRDQAQESVQKGKKIILKGIAESDTYNLTIKKIYKDRILLSVNDLSIKAGKDFDKKGTDLTGCKGIQDVELKKGERIQLSTCSMDAGVTWVISY